MVRVSKALKKLTFRQTASAVLVSLTLLLAACAPTGDGNAAETPADTTAESVTNPPTDAPAETPADPETEAPTETETEPDTEPEVLVSATAPNKILNNLVGRVSPRRISSVCMQVTLPQQGIDTVQDAFLREGYLLAATTPAHGTNLGTAVLKSLEHTVTLMETADGFLHVLWEKANSVTTDPLYAVQNPEKGDVTMAQIGIARGDQNDNPMIGMCYVYRLSDGTALIIDGGINNVACSVNLFRTLRRLDIARDEDGRYRITAWIFTHGHADHMGTFKRFSAQYADRTDLAYVMYSFPTEEVAPKGNTTGEEFAEIIRLTYPKAKRVSPHAGLTYFFGNLSVHMLYAPELLYNSPEGVNYYNTTSLLFRIEANGQSVLHMGDASEAASEAAWINHESTAFQSNALQITHHGLYTGPDSHDWGYMKKLYHATDAKIGLLPMGTRNPGDARNGRHTVLVGWGNAGHQVSFVVDTRDSHNGKALDQAYFARFVAEVAAGTNQKPTLFGYDGVNTVKNRSGMVTYISAGEDAPMATVFNLGEGGFTVVSNEKLDTWLGE